MDVSDDQGSLARSRSSSPDNDDSVEEVRKLVTITDMALQRSEHLLSELRASGLCDEQTEHVKVSNARGVGTEEIEEPSMKTGVAQRRLDTVDVPVALLDLMAEMWKHIKPDVAGPLRVATAEKKICGSETKTFPLTSAAFRQSAGMYDGHSDELSTTASSCDSPVSSPVLLARTIPTPHGANRSGSLLVSSMDTERTTGSHHQLPPDARHCAAQDPVAVQSAPRPARHSPLRRLPQQHRSPFGVQRWSSSAGSLTPGVDHFRRLPPIQPVKRVTEIVRITDVYHFAV